MEKMSADTCDADSDVTIDPNEEDFDSDSTFDPNESEKGSCITTIARSSGDDKISVAKKPYLFKNISSSVHEISDDSENENSGSCLKDEKVKSKYNANSNNSAKSPSKIKRKSDALAATPTKIKDSSCGSGHKASTKPACPYGKKCYRKNPSHHEEFSHDSIEGKLIQASKRVHAGGDVFYYR